LLLQLTVSTISSRGTGNSSQVLDDLLGVFSLTSTGFAAKAELKSPCIGVTYVKIMD
jgi:hypothetical protein